MAAGSTNIQPAARSRSAEARSEAQRDNRKRPPYVGALDGLRGLAVVAVLLYHGNVPGMRGGFLGVSTFFTLSGFLITSMLLSEYQSTGRIGLGSFWASRARRLLPAATVTLLGVVVFARTVATPTQLAGLRGDLIATVLYMTNWRFALTGRSYAGLGSVSSPVQHFWSLAIEEQFYLFLPLAVAAAIRWTRQPHRTIAVGSAVLIVVSALVSFKVGGGVDGSTRAYFGTDVRAAELLIGVLLAATIRHIAAWPMRVIALGWAGPLALAVMIAAFVTVDQQSLSLYRGGLLAHALLSVIVLLAGFQPGPLRQLLTCSPLRWLGRISYAAYLYHWPLFMLLDTDRVGLEGIPLLVLRLGVTIAAAHVSTRFFEEPIRVRDLLPRLRPIVLAPLAAVMVMAVATVPAVDLDSGSSGIHVTAGNRVKAANNTGPALTGTKVERLLLVGDSISRQAAPAFAARFPETDVRWVGRNGTGLLTEQGALLEWLADKIESFDPDVVVIESVGVYTDMEGGPPYVTKDGIPVPDRSELMFEAWKVQAQRAVDIARSRGALVIWGTTPPIKSDSWFGALASRVETVNAIYRELEHAVVIDWWAMTAPNGEFAAELRSQSGGVQTARNIDGLHFTTFGNELLVDMTEPAITAYERRSAPSDGVADPP